MSGRLATVVTTLGGQLRRSRASCGIAWAQLRQFRIRTALAVVGIAVAILLVITLAGLGVGMLTAGSDAIAWIDRGLWVGGGAVELAPGAVGNVENPIQDAHAVSTDMEGHSGVNRAQPLAFQTVYVSTDGQTFSTIIGVGVGGDGSGITPGKAPFSTSDVHYANGSYDGPMTHEVVVDRSAAERFDLSEGDTLYVGGTLANARANEFEVVGVVNSFSTFLGAPAVGLHLSELQTVSGTTGRDRASLIAVTLEPDADPEAVRSDLAAAYPSLEVRTNHQQLRAIMGNQGAVVASAGTLVVLAVVVGLILIVNVLSLLVYQHRTRLAALKAAGISGRTLVTVVGMQGALLGIIGGAVGVLATPPTVWVVNQGVAYLTGFPQLVKTPLWLLGAGFGIAIVMGSVGAMVAGWRVARLTPLEHLR